jgi:hypothetical protein
MTTQLLFEIFEKEGDRFVKDIDISHYDINTLNEICPPEDEGDIYYCNGFFIEENQFLELKKIISEIEKYDYEMYDYNLTTRSLWR